ncbi:RsfA family transcriptional regulator [Paenisporosarcina sp. FSL H8-0542]|uniref:RsfA family transcriptional regulator n=1 Tax=unclassified Paenisporosarcina TaxID=2642018 RepID=UPI00034E33DE|nr:RsfA family transcriptional regulator [Paenisporosarcina sp. HGH0030]EPD51213.1 RsfA family transcription factor [Paenisporosarcina sp. HGH0030]
MVKIRQDAWLDENDELLAETVLRHVREGSTQLNAFEEAGDALNRTAAACGFRWNAVVRREYEKDLREAKKDRKQKMRVLGKEYRRRGQSLFLVGSEEQPQERVQIPLSALSLDVVIAYLLRLQQNGTGEGESHRWRALLSHSQEKIKQLERDIARLENENSTIREDYEQFVHIMNRARRLVTLNDDAENISPVFQMERNGNLVAKEPPIN